MRMIKIRGIKTALKNIVAAAIPSTSVKSIDEIEEQKFYRVADGKYEHFVFKYCDGKTRGIFDLDQLNRILRGHPTIDISGDVFSLLSAGPPMPLGNGETLDELLEKSNSIELIREAFCTNFTGSGYEIGAGRRPTILPVDCTVEYIDKFTFDEASDGSWSGIEDSSGFVKISYFDSMESLESIEDASADFFIACHVIEHVSDVISAIIEACKKLKSSKNFSLSSHIKNIFLIKKETQPIFLIS